MASRPRKASLVLLVAGLALVAVSFFVPWWSFERTRPESGHQWEGYGPFSRDERAAGGQFKEEVRWLGLMATASGALLGATTLLAAANVSPRRTRFRWAALLALVTAAAGILTLLVAFAKLPAEAQAIREGYDLNFFGSSDCQGSFVDPERQVCAATRVGAGWFLAGAGFVVLPLAAVVAAGRGGGSQARARPAAPAPAPPPPPRGEMPLPARPIPRSVASPGARRPAPMGRSLVTKCPQCQTRVAYHRAESGPTRVQCHNCGQSFRL